MNTIKIVKIESPQSLAACAKVLVDTYNSEPWNDAWTHEKALEKLSCFYHSPRFHGLMAYSDNVLLGCCIGNIEPYFSGDYYYLKEMFVSPAAQNKGVGRLLMSTIKKQMEEMEIRSIILFTSNAVFPFAFYEKAGFGEMKGMRMMYFGPEG